MGEYEFNLLIRKIKGMELFLTFEFNKIGD